MQVLTFKMIQSNQGIEDKITPIAKVNNPKTMTASRPVNRKENIWDQIGCNMQ